MKRGKCSCVSFLYVIFCSRKINIRGALISAESEVVTSDPFNLLDNASVGRL